MPNAVGGVENPRVLVCGPELVSNRSFEENLDGVGGAIFTRELDVTTPFGDYILGVEDATASQDFVEITIETGAAIAGKHFVVLAYSRNDVDSLQSIWTDFNGLAGDTFADHEVDGVWRQAIVHEVMVPGGSSGTELKFDIYPTPRMGVGADTGKIRVDMVRCREVLSAFELPEIPRDGLQKAFIPEFQAKNRMLSGIVKTYGRKVRFLYEAVYEHLDPSDEVLRRKLISSPDDILFFPHKDSSNVFFVEWNNDNDYEDLHAFGMGEAGNAGNISLIGMELLPQPATTAADGYIFVEDSIII